MCEVPVDVVERALVDSNRETVLILAKALDFSWATTMSLLFLGAPNYRITAGELERMKNDFQKLNVETSNHVLSVYRSRNDGAIEDSRSRAATAGELNNLSQLKLG